MREWVECDRYFPFEPFVVLTVDRAIGHGGGPLDRQKRDSQVYRKAGTWPLISEKPESSQPTRWSLRNCGKGMEFFWNSQLNLSFLKTLNHFQTILRLVLSLSNLHLFHSNATETRATFWSEVHFKPITNLELSNALAHDAKLVLSFIT